MGAVAASAPFRPTTPGPSNNPPNDLGLLQPSQASITARLALGPPAGAQVSTPFLQRIRDNVGQIAADSGFTPVQTTSMTGASSGGAPGAQFGPPGVGSAPPGTLLSGPIVTVLKLAPVGAAIYFLVKGDRSAALAAGAVAAGAFFLL